jgi:hypothetical protein
MVLLNSDATIQIRPLQSGEYLVKSSMTEIFIDAGFVSPLGLPCINLNSGDIHNLALCLVAALS